MQINKVSLVSAIIIILCLGQVAAAETIFSGTVFEFRSDKKLKDVTVIVKNASDGKELARGNTKIDGSYKITSESNPENFDITYDPPDTATYDPAGRSGVMRATTEMGLDTIGLTNKKSGKRDRAEKDQHARNTAGYVRARGDAAQAQQAVRDAYLRFDAYISTAKQFGVKQAFEQRNVPFPTGRKESLRRGSHWRMLKEFLYVGDATRSFALRSECPRCILWVAGVDRTS